MGFLIWVSDRLKERSTWMGIIGLVSAVGVTLEPSQTEAIATAGIALAGLIAVFTKG